MTYPELMQNIKTALTDLTLTGQTQIEYCDFGFKLPADLANNQFPAALITEGTFQFDETGHVQTSPLYIFCYYQATDNNYLTLRQAFQDQVLQTLSDRDTHKFAYFLHLQRIEYLQVFSVLGWQAPLFPPFYGFRLDYELITDRIES